MFASTSNAALRPMIPCGPRLARWRFGVPVSTSRHPRQPLPIPLPRPNYFRDMTSPYSTSTKPDPKPRQHYDHSHDRLHQDDEHEYPLRPPPISARLRPLIPFFIYWCAITSLAVHLLRNRVSSREELDKAQAQISVLEGLIERHKRGERVGGDEVQRELEMVGLRERLLTKPEEGEGGDVGWLKAIFGRKGVRDDEAEKERIEEEAVQEWAKVVNEATSTHKPAPALQASPSRTGTARRAPSSNVYL